MANRAASGTISAVLGNLKFHMEGYAVSQDLRTRLVTNSLLSSYSLPLSESLVSCSRVLRRSSVRFTSSPLSILLEIMVSALI